jgi:hypothetical protein
MDLSDLIEKLEEISYNEDCFNPEIILQIGGIQVPLESVTYIPENEYFGEMIILR